MKRWLVLLAACGHHDAAPCTRSVHVEMLRVDDGSEYMKQIYEHVGADGKGQPSDQEAIAAHVTANIDTWNESTTRAGMDLPGPPHLDYHLESPDRVALEGYLAKMPAPPSDHRIVYERVDYGRPNEVAHWRSFYVFAKPLADDTDFAEVSHLPPRTATLREGVQTPHSGVWIIFTDKARAAFATATAKIGGHKLATMVDGVVMIAAIIKGPIKVGKVQLETSALDEQRILKGLCSLGE